jgi:L-iditol 2-dehydrogenase
MSGDGRMDALVLHAVGDLRLERIAVPPLGPGQARVRVAYCGVCGSDIPRIFTKGTYRFPTVCGHEFAGTVSDVAADVTSVRPGDRVAVFPLLWCGTCAPCEQGRYVQCENYDYLGSRRDGGFAEFIAAPACNLLKVPDAVSLEEAAMTEPASVALHALRRAGGAIVGESVAILGAGPIGLMVAQWARAMGAARIILFDLVPQKLEQARAMGFEHACNSRDHDPAKTVESLTGGRGADVSVDAAGVPAALIQACRSAARGGRVVLLGNPSADVTLPAALLSQLMRREVSLVGTWNSDYSAAGNPDDWRTTLAARASRAIDLRPLITHRVPLAGSIDMLRRMKDGGEFYSKVLIQPTAQMP